MKNGRRNGMAWTFGGLWVVLVGTWLAVVVAGAGRLVQRPSLGLAIGFLTEGVLLAGGIRGALRWGHRFRERTWPWFLLIAGFGMKVPALLLSSTYVQTADRGFFVSFVNRLAETGLSAAGIGEMAGSVYDFYSFFPRSFALALPLRFLVGEESMVAAHQWINLAMGVLSTWMVYELFRVLFRERTARLASVLHLLFPLRNLVVLDMAHQVAGEFTLLLGLLAVLGVMSVDGAGRRIIGAAVLAACLFFGHLLVGVEWLLALLGSGLLAVAWRTFPAGGRRSNVLALGGSVLLAGVAIHGFASWQARVAPAPLSSGQPGFMARGWSFRFLGEYDARLEQVDREAPPDVKADVMRAYVGSQIRNHPARVFGVLLPVKAVKYFLPGYASGTEQALRAGGLERASEGMAGARILYALLLLGAAIPGCLNRSGKGVETRGTAWCLAFLGLFGAAQVLGGETSPRYAYFMHFLLIGIAARGLESPAGFQGARTWTAAGILHAGLYGGLSVLTALGFRMVGEWRFLRGGDTLTMDAPAGVWSSGDRHDRDYVWQTVLPGGRPANVRLSVTRIPDDHSLLHVFLASGMPGGWDVSADGRTWRDMRGVQSLMLPVGSRGRKEAGSEGQALLYFRPGGSGDAEGLPLQLGYVLTGAWTMSPE